MLSQAAGGLKSRIAHFDLPALAKTYLGELPMDLPVLAYTCLDFHAEIRQSLAEEGFLVSFGSNFALFDFHRLAQTT